jgi:hypothetical protein
MADMNLKIKIGSDSKQAEDSVGRVNAALKGLESSSQKLNGMLSGMGVALSVSGFAAFVKSGIDAADALNDLADRSGIAIEKLAGLEYAVKIGDTSMESFISASNKLSINISKNAEDFAKLGITANDPVEAFKQLADVFSSIEDPQQRAAVGAAALGKSYAEMAPLLMMGAEGIQELINKGQEHNPVTAEQARLAGELNDKIGELQNRFQSFSIVIAGPVIEALNGFAQGIAFANEQMDGFDPLGWLDAGGYGASGKAGQLQYINEQIDQTGKSLKALENQGPAGQFVDMLFGSDYEDQAAKLAKLTAQRDKLMAPPPAATTTNAPSTAALDNFIKKSGDAETASKKLSAAHSAAASTESARADSIKSIVDNLQFEISLTGQSADVQNQLREIRTATSKATADEAIAIEALIKTKYELVEADQILAEGEKLAAKQRTDSADEYNRLTQLFSGENQAMYGQFDEAFKAKGLGIIDDQQLSKSLENISQGFDVITGKAQESTDQMSEFTVQAARNMQTAFADFLFDPFTQGADGMLESFGNVLRRMAAEAASAQIMDGLFGAVGDKGQRDFSGGLISAGFSALGGLFGFADGGIMTSGGPLPLRKYAGGGVANSPQLALFGEGRMNEAFVPLPDGRSIPVSLNGGNSGVTVNVINNANGTETTTRERQTAQGREIDVIIEQKVRKAMADEKRQGGMFAGMPA